MMWQLTSGSWFLYHQTKQISYNYYLSFPSDLEFAEQIEKVIQIFTLLLFLLFYYYYHNLL